MDLLSQETGIILVWAVNLAVGTGLVLLGAVMVRRPERVWVGVRVARDPGEAARVRRANQRTAPWMLALGLAEVLSGPIALISGMSPLSLAVSGLVFLLMAIAVLTLAAVLSR